MNLLTRSNLKIPLCPLVPLTYWSYFVKREPERPDKSVNSSVKLLSYSGSKKKQVGFAILELSHKVWYFDKYHLLKRFIKPSLIV